MQVGTTTTVLALADYICCFFFPDQHQHWCTETSLCCVCCAFTRVHVSEYPASQSAIRSLLGGLPLSLCGEKGNTKFSFCSPPELGCFGCIQTSNIIVGALVLNYPSPKTERFDFLLL